MEKMQTNSNMKYGASFDRATGKVNFKLASCSAEDVVLCVFKKPVGDIPFLEVKMEKNENVFTASIDKKHLFKYGKVFYYGYRVFGANFKFSTEYKAGSDIGFISKLDSQGNRFNPNKLAYDPYSVELSHFHSEISSELEAFRSGDKNYLSDNSKIAPKSVFRLVKETKINKVKKRAFKDEIIAEVHIKDLTRLLKLPFRGTYKAAKSFVKKIKETGVTMVEFLPLQEFDSFVDKGNHWGYMPLNYFSIKKLFSSDKTPCGALYEFRSLINEFHKQGIKVCMDVVYNHTGEGRTYCSNDDANLFSYALIDNKGYYKLAQNAHYTNHSGCSNDLNTLNPLVSDLIVESLSFWINQGIDAFRFDLAVHLMDSSSSGYAMYDKNSGLLKNLKERLEKLGHKIVSPNEVSNGVVLIAEPWMCQGAYSYQLGNFPSYFCEWNDVSRDTIRAFTVNPHNVNPQGIRRVIEGTPDKFHKEQRSINYVSCHDGYTLFDLNNYDRPNPSTRGGFEGELSSSYNGNVLQQDNAIRKQILILMVSFGIPMVQFGDIFLHSKNGNNNSYNLDDKTNWINYKLDKRKSSLNEFILKMIQFRKENPIFSDPNYPEKIEYYFPCGSLIQENDDSYWKNNFSDIICFKIKDKNRNYFIAISKDENPIKVFLPEKSFGKWYLIADTKNGFIDLKGKVQDKVLFELQPFGACIFVEK